MDAKPGEQQITYHEQDGNSILKYSQDVEPHLEYAAACRREDAEQRGTFGKRAEFRRTMSVPFNVLLDICTKYGLDFYNAEDAKIVLSIVKGPEYAKFRTVADKNI